MVQKKNLHRKEEETKEKKTWLLKMAVVGNLWMDGILHKHLVKELMESKYFFLFNFY